VRKPVDAGKPKATREDLWAVMRTLNVFTIRQLAAEIDLDARAINLYATSLLKAGYLKKENNVELQERGGAYHARYSYRVIKGSVDAPRVRDDGTAVTQGQGRLNMWRSMRVLKNFSITDIVACSSTEEHPVAWAEAEMYVRYLEKAGYIRKATKGLPLGRAIFALVRWTGIKAPMIQRIKRVWDPNLKQITWQSAEIGTKAGEKS
jgi:hypothetical protein